MWHALRKALSRKIEDLLRWLTASALRSTAIFVILTFVPILLLTYYIVATSIRNSNAQAASADRESRDFAVSLLRADFAGEREAVTGAADLSTLERELSLQAQLPPPRTTPPASTPPPHPKAAAPLPYRQRRLQQQLAAARRQAQLSLVRLHHRRPEFYAVALYDAAGNLQAVAPAQTPLAPVLSRPSASWFRSALAGQNSTSPVQVATPQLPARLIFAAQVSFSVPNPSGKALSQSGVLVGILPTSAVAAWISRINLPSDRYLYLVDRAHNLIYASPSGPFARSQVTQLPAIAQALAGHSGSGEYVSAIQLENHAIAYAPLPAEDMALLVVRPVRFSLYIYRVFYDKLAFIAVIIFLLAVATGLLLRSAFRYYQRYNKEVESGRSKTEALLGSIGDGVFAVDRAGHIIEFNRAAAALTGENAAAVLHKPYQEAIALAQERGGQAAAPLPIDPVSRAMNEGRTFRFLRDLTLLRRDGTRLPVTVSAAPVRDERGGVEGCVVVFSDASQEREVDRMKNEFISIASHQLRTPMSGVKGVLALLLEQVLGPLNADQQKYLRRAYESNERLIALVNDLLNISRLEQGSLLLRTERVNLTEVISSLTAEFQPRAARYHQRLQILPMLPPAAADEGVVEGDPVRLREAFSNLLDNAIKYTPEGGAINVLERCDPHQVVIEISDNGVGIPPEKLPTLFQKFNRIQNPLSNREFGSGLGLYFAHSVIELHQGTIEVESQPGQGTTFRVALPRQHPAAVPAA